ncbi:hypothetical protein U0070_024730 [Myodes glareolus]|uniref:Uncharacterized protein n=1 Tax=Myodes glareolus TaxID=447135 RepID=A0AAW0HWR4_MYOGA
MIPSRADTGGGSGGGDSAPNPQRCTLRAPPAPTAWPAARAPSAPNPADCCLGPGPAHRAPSRRNEPSGVVIAVWECGCEGSELPPSGEETPGRRKSPS